MADQAMSAQKVRAMLIQNLERVRKASNEYFQMTSSRGRFFTPKPPVIGSTRIKCCRHATTSAIGLAV
jgi:hypothetical protein